MTLVGWMCAMEETDHRETRVKMAIRRTADLGMAKECLVCGKLS